MAAYALPWPWKWATLTWAHPGYPHTGPCADTGSNLENRSPPAAHRPFLGKKNEGETGEKLPPSCPDSQPAQEKAPVDTEVGPQPFCPRELGSGHVRQCSPPHRHSNPTYLHTAGGTDSCSCPHHPHRCPHWHMHAPHSRLCSPNR